MIFPGAGPPKEEGNRALFEQLFAQGRMPIRRAAWFDRAPQGRPVGWDRVRGMLLGLAIGDALGNTSEGMLPWQRRERFGEIRHYLPNRHASWQAVGLPSDDSQMTFWTLEVLLERGFLDLPRLAERFAEGPIFGIGSTVSSFLDRYRNSTDLWDAAVPSAGNGALMRIAPVLVPYLTSPSANLWSDAALLTRLTHNDSMAVASSVAFVHLLWLCLSTHGVPDRNWWLAAFLEPLAELETRGGYSRRDPAFGSFRGRLQDFLREVLPRSLPAAGKEPGERSPAEVLGYSGAYLLETVPWVLFLLSRWGHDPEEAVVRAVNDTKDNDTIGALVGAAVGALHGEGAFPSRWRKHLIGRTGRTDDGRIFSLLAQAEARWGW